MDKTSRGLLGAFRQSIRSTSMSTIRAYMTDVEMFLEHLEEKGIPFEASTAQTLLKYLEEEKYKKSTAMRKAASIGLLYKLEHRRIHIDERDLSQFPYTEPSRPITEEEFQIYLTAVRDTNREENIQALFKRKRDQLWPVLVYRGGLRLFELTTLGHNDITINPEQITISPKRIRRPEIATLTIPLTDGDSEIQDYHSIRAYLLEYRKVESPEAILNILGRPLSHRSLRRNLELYAASAKLLHTTLKSLIHGYKNNNPSPRTASAA